MRTTKVFKNGRSVAVRLPGECRIAEGTEVSVTYQDGRIIVEPLNNGWPQSFIEAIHSKDPELESFELTPKQPMPHQNLFENWSD